MGTRLPSPTRGVAVPSGLPRMDIMALLFLVVNTAENLLQQMAWLGDSVGFPKE